MELIEKMVVNNPCYKSGRTRTKTIGIMAHSIGTPQPSGTVMVNIWNSSSSGTAVHAVIDANDGRIYQMMPWNRRAWHCGSGSKGSGNDGYIGVEMCEPSTIKYTGGSSFQDLNPEKSKAAVKRAYNSMVELFAYLCNMYKLDPLRDGVIISHSEGCARGIASNHGDVEHLWSKYGLTMSQFRKDIKVAMSGKTTTESTKVSSTKISTTSKTTTAKKTIEEIAKEVISGKWGNNPDRQKKLEKAGYNYEKVQAKVDELMGKTTKKSNNAIAKEVIAGKWGSGNDRVKKLTAAGYNATTIQNIVNKLMKK